MPTQGPFGDGDDRLTATVNVDRSLRDLVEQKISECRADVVAWSGDSVMRQGGNYRVGVDGFDVDEAITDAICEHIAARDSLDVSPDDIVVASVHLEPGKPSYIEVYVNE